MHLQCFNRSMSHSIENNAAINSLKIQTNCFNRSMSHSIENAASLLVSGLILTLAFQSVNASFNLKLAHIQFQQLTS